VNAAAKTAAETAWIAETAHSLGFDLCGVTAAQDFPELANMRDWLERGYAGEMKYLHDPRRADLQSAMSGVRSVIVCAINYNSSEPYSTEIARVNRARTISPRGWISRYGVGKRLSRSALGQTECARGGDAEEICGTFEARASADTGPVQERILAKHAGLGWIGKNTLLLNQKMGSWLFLGTILTDLELTPTIEDREFLPTRFVRNLHALHCRLPYRCAGGSVRHGCAPLHRFLTIEMRAQFRWNFASRWGITFSFVDICQDVCPWNRKSPKAEAEEFQPRKTGDAGESLFHPRLELLANLSEEEYREVFRGSAMKRAKWRGILRNACNALGNAGLQRDTETGNRIAALLTKLSAADDEIISESAQWAAAKLSGGLKFGLTCGRNA